MHVSIEIYECFDQAKKKMKAFNWSKLPLKKILDNKISIWSDISKKFVKTKERHRMIKFDIDFEDMEQLFCVQETKKKEKKATVCI